MHYLLFLFSVLQVKENFSRRTVTNIKLIDQNFLKTHSASVKMKKKSFGADPVYIVSVSQKPVCGLKPNLLGLNKWHRV